MQYHGSSDTAIHTYTSGGIFLGQFVQWNLTNSFAICTCSLKESPVLNVLSQGKHQKLVGPWVFFVFF